MANSTVLPQLSRLQSLATQGTLSSTIPPYFLPTSHSMRQHHPLHYILPQPYQYSYFYRAVKLMIGTSSKSLNSDATSINIVIVRM